jgi:hypothetical protein
MRAIATTVRRRARTTRASASHASPTECRSVRDTRQASSDRPVGQGVRARPGIPPPERPPEHGEAIEAERVRRWRDIAAPVGARRQRSRERRRLLWRRTRWRRWRAASRASRLPIKTLAGLVADLFGIDGVPVSQLGHIPGRPSRLFADAGSRIARVARTVQFRSWGSTRAPSVQLAQRS